MLTKILVYDLAIKQSFRVFEQNISALFTWIGLPTNGPLVGAVDACHLAQKLWSPLHDAGTDAIMFSFSSLSIYNTPTTIRNIRTHFLISEYS